VLRFTLIAIATLFAAGVVILVVVSIVGDDFEVVEVGSLLLFPSSTVASFAVLVAMIVESRSLQIAWRAVGWWLPLTVVIGLFWLVYVSSWGMALAHGGERVPLFFSEKMMIVLVNAVFVVPQTLVAVHLWRRLQAQHKEPSN